MSSKAVKRDPYDTSLCDENDSSTVLCSLTQQMSVSFLFKVMANALSVTLMSGLVH